MSSFAVCVRARLHGSLILQCYFIDSVILKCKACLCLHLSILLQERLLSFKSWKNKTLDVPSYSRFICIFVQLVLHTYQKLILPLIYICMYIKVVNLSRASTANNDICKVLWLSLSQACWRLTFLKECGFRQNCLRWRFQMRTISNSRPILHWPTRWLIH